MILFFSDRDDPIFYAAYKKISEKYECLYSKEFSKCDVVVTNNTNIEASEKVIYYSTDLNNDFNVPINLRRNLINWFKSCSNIICSSVYLSRCFYQQFKIKAYIQYPCNPDYIIHDPQKIVYSPDFNIDFLKKEFGEDIFLKLNSIDDIGKAKLYLCNKKHFIDQCLSFTCENGIPVIMDNKNYLKEFLEVGDFILHEQMNDLMKIQVIKRSLNITKAKHKKYSEVSTLEDKIKQALAKKPTCFSQLTPEQKRMFLLKQQSQGKIHNKQQSRRVINTAVAPKYQPQLLPPSENTIYVTGGVVGISGYDNLVKEIITGLKCFNIDVRINSRSPIKYDVCPPYFREIHVKKLPECFNILICPPCVMHINGEINKKTVIFTMWETDHLEKSWVDQMNKAAFIIVPSQWAVDCFMKSGIQIPIYKCPLGYNSLYYNPTNKFPEVCTFGTAAALSAGGLRKNTSHIIDLFRQAFPSEENVKLKVKVTPGCNIKDTNDPRVEIIKRFLPPYQFAEWYRSLSAFVNASYAEGFGLHLIEAMACGRMLISTNYSAVSEYFNEDVGIVVGHKLTKASGGAYSGHWAKANDHEIIKAMQSVYNNPSEAKIKGEQAFDRAQDFTWKAFGRNLSEILYSNGVIK